MFIRLLLNSKESLEYVCLRWLVNGLYILHLPYILSIGLAMLPQSEHTGLVCIGAQNLLACELYRVDKSIDRMVCLWLCLVCFLLNSISSSEMVLCILLTSTCPSNYLFVRVVANISYTFSSLMYNFIRSAVLEVEQGISYINATFYNTGTQILVSVCN